MKWSSSPVATSASLPYMWTRTVITYTDNATSTSYSVGCTPEGVSVGGRNLYTGTRDFSGTKWYYRDSYVFDGTYNGFKVWKRTGAWNGSWQSISVEAGDVFTFSAWAKRSSSGPYVGCFLNGSAVTGEAIYSNETQWPVNQWFKLIHTTKITKAGQMHYGIESNNSNPWWICGIKLEKGNKATDWSPAPEDQVAVGDVVNQVNSELKISGNSIALTTGHFTISAKNLTLDSAGNATFSGTVKAASIEGSTITGAAGEFTKSFSVKIPYGEESPDIGYWRIDFNGQNGFIGYKSDPATVIGIEFSNIGAHTAGGSIDKNYLRVDANDLCIDTRTIIRKNNYPAIYFSTETDCVVPQTDPVDGYTCGCIRYYKNNGHMQIISRNGLRIQDQIGYGYAMHGWDSGAHLYSCWWDDSALHFYVDRTNVWTSSDRRLKKDITQIKNAYIEAIGKVDLVQYRLNRPGYHDNNIHFGAIAQDIIREFDNKCMPSDNLKMIFKDRIQIDNSTLYYGMDYEQFLILRLAYNEKIIKQMQKEIAELKGDKNENV